MTDPCIFCRIVAGTLPSHKVWEDSHHLAFLSIFPNTPGFTVLVTKDHYPSDAMRLSEPVLTRLLLAAKAVNAQLVRAFDDVDRCAVVMEGFGIDHVHIKLIPLHGTRMDAWRPILAEGTSYSPDYLGFIDTHDGPRADNRDLAHVAERIRSS